MLGRSILSRQAKEKGQQVRAMGVFLSAVEHIFNETATQARTIGKRSSWQSKQSKSWSTSEGKGKSKENNAKSNGSEGAKGSCKGKT